MSFPLYSSLCSSTHSPCFWSWPLTDKVIFLKHKSHYSITLLKILSWLLNVACHTQYFSNDELLASQVRLFFVDHCIPSLPVALLTQSPPQCVGTILGWGQLHNLPSFLNNALHLIFYNHLPHASLLEPECTISSLLGYATSLSYDRALVMLLSPSCCSCPSLKHSEFKTQLRHYLFSEAFPYPFRGWDPLSVLLKHPEKLLLQHLFYFNYISWVFFSSTQTLNILGSEIIFSSSLYLQCLAQCLAHDIYPRNACSMD